MCIKNYFSYFYRSPSHREDSTSYTVTHCRISVRNNHDVCELTADVYEGIWLVGKCFNCTHKP